MKTANWFERILLRRSPPQFGMLATWLLLISCVALALWPFEPAAGEHRPYATILGWLPADVLRSDAAFLIARAVLLGGAILWGLRLLTPWSCWATVLAMTALWSLRMENVWSGAHIYNIPNMLLVVHALWYTFYDRDMKSAIRENRFWESGLYPQWVYLLAVFYVGIYHTLAGVAKIAYSGFDWGNGLSLQLWVYLWGIKTTWPYQWIIASRLFTRIIPTAALVIETASVLAVFNRWLRIIIGVGLVGFYVNVIWIFGYGFHFNLLFTALFMLPFFEVVNYFATRRANKPTETKTEAVAEAEAVLQK